MIVEVLSFDGCPYAKDVHALVLRCIRQLGLGVAIHERFGDYPSPTVLVNGRDVMGAPASSGPSCRLDLPTEERIVAVLRQALEGTRR